MFQFPGQGKPARGIFLDCDFGKSIDSVLALALLHGLENKREARIASITIGTPSLKAAQLCDVVEKFYASANAGPALGFYQVIGLVSDGGASTPLTSLLSRKDAAGKPVYTPRIATINDTAEPTVFLRNMLLAQYDQNAVVVLAGPATNLVALLDMGGCAELIAKKVKFLSLAGGNYPDGATEPNLAADIPAAKRLFTEWPTPIIAAGRDAMSGIVFPASSIEKDFSYNANHPVADAYRAFQQMPYDAPTLDMAAVLYAVRPQSGYFRLSEPGTIAVGNDGRTRFQAGGGKKHQYLIPDPAQREKIVSVYVEMASAKPVSRARRPLDQQVDEKKDDPPVISKQQPSKQE